MSGDNQSSRAEFVQQQLENMHVSYLSLVSVNCTILNPVRFLCPRDDSQGALRFAPVCPSITLYGIEFV